MNGRDNSYGTNRSTGNIRIIDDNSIDSDQGTEGAAGTSFITVIDISDHQIGLTYPATEGEVGDGRMVEENPYTDNEDSIHSSFNQSTNIAGCYHDNLPSIYDGSQGHDIYNSGSSADPRSRSMSPQPLPYVNATDDWSDCSQSTRPRVTVSSRHGRKLFPIAGASTSYGASDTQELVEPEPKGCCCSMSPCCAGCNIL